MEFTLQTTVVAYDESNLSELSESTSDFSSDFSTSTTEVDSEPEQKLLPGIIVMNHKYFKDVRQEAPKNGDMPFVMAVIKVLRDADAFLGIILYRKSDQIFPTIAHTVINDVNCIVIPFNTLMWPALVTDAVSKACRDLRRLAGRTDKCSIEMMYHQDERLLEAQPLDTPFSITHHAPIVSDVFRYYPNSEDILDAFGTEAKNPRKVTELRTLQDAGLEVLRRRANGFVLAISDIQRSHFLNSGILEQNIFSIPPPLRAMLSAHSPKQNTDDLLGVNRKYFLFTAVARTTWFKHLELLVYAASRLWRREIDVSLFIAGGDSSIPHTALRKRLLDLVPQRYRDHALIVPRIPQENLYRYFASRKVQVTGIFVCCSRYETLGITPLEAALCGVTTVITDTKQIEATRYFPAEYRFKDNAKALADRLEALFSSDLLATGLALKEYVKTATEARGDFATEFLKVWAGLSQHQHDAVERNRKYRRNIQ